MRQRLGTSLFLLLVVTMIMTTGPARATEEIPREYRVKAAFVQRFLDFVTWTAEGADHDGPVLVCVIGDSPMRAALGDLAGEPGMGRELQMGTAEELTKEGCGVFFIAATVDGVPRADHPDWQDLRELSATGVLTIGEDPGFHLAGGVINFFAQGDRLRFSVSERAAKRAGLKIGSKLMRLALIVE